jgi:hypothetical protein
MWDRLPRFRRRVVRVLGLGVSLLLLLGIVAPPGASQAQRPRQAGAELPVYRLATPNVTPDTVRNLAGSAFDLSGDVEKVDDRFVLTSGANVVDVYTPSGGAWFANTAEVWNPASKPTLPSDSVAREIAQGFLTNNKLLPSGQQFFTEFLGIGGTQRATLTAGTNDRVVQQIDKQATFGVVLLNGNQQIPVVGGGGEFNVTIGDQNRIIGYSGVWRPIAESIGTFPVIPQDQANKLFLESLGDIDVRNFDATLAYYSAPSPVAQTFLYPMYVYSGTATINGQTVALRNMMIPATSFSVQASITAPTEDDITIPASQPISFSGAASGGTAPYNYRWESNIDGLLGTTQTITPRLSFVPKDGGFTSHTITLIVTDANGTTATASRNVTLQGQQVLLPLAIQGTGQPPAGTPGEPGAITRVPDEGIFEAGTSWIGEVGGLGGSRNNAGGFVNTLRSAGWRINFNWGNNAAFHSDWISNDDSWVDTADFVFYTGHANGDGWQAINRGGDGWVSWDETVPAHSPRDVWGSDDLEWLIVAACGPLQDNVISPGGGDVFRWVNAFDGLHLLLGYGAITYDNEVEGRTVVNYMRGGQKIVDAWFRTAREVQPYRNGEDPPNGPIIWVGVVYVAQPGRDPINDRLPGTGPWSADPIAPTDYVAFWTTT